MIRIELVLRGEPAIIAFLSRELMLWHEAAIAGEEVDFLFSGTFNKA